MHGFSAVDLRLREYRSQPANIRGGALSNLLLPRRFV
jgi:hypothetical protein